MEANFRRVRCEHPLMDDIRIGNRSCTWEDAHQFAATYLSAKDPWSYPAYDGYMIDQATGPLTDADLLAPVLLNVSQLRVATFYRLQAEVPRLQSILNELSPDLRLSDATTAEVQLIGTLFEGIDAGRLTGARATTLSKILHRKRPALIPLQDEQVRRCYQEGADAPLPVVRGRNWVDFTTELTAAIQADLVTQHQAFDELAALASDVPITPLRAFDLTAWRLGRSENQSPSSDFEESGSY